MGKSILNSLLIIIAFSGCYREIKVDFPEHDPKLVVVAEAVVGEKMKVYVSKTSRFEDGFDFDEPLKKEFLNSLQYSLIVNGQRIDSYTSVGETQWYYSYYIEFEYFPQTEDEIDLTVTAPNFGSVNFKEMVPNKPVNFNLESIKDYYNQSFSVDMKEISFSLDVNTGQHLSIRAVNNFENSYPERPNNNPVYLYGNSPDYFYEYYDVLATDYTSPDYLTNPAYAECNHNGSQYRNRVYLNESAFENENMEAIYLDISYMPKNAYTYITKFIFSRNSNGDIFTTDVTIPLSPDGNGYGYLLCLNYASVKIK